MSILQMDQLERKKIGILFYYGRNWMGGVMYIINLIKSIDKLSDSEKPEIILFFNDNSQPFVSEISYPYLKEVYRMPKNEYVNYIFSVIKGKNCFEDGLLEQYQLDGLFPLNDFPFKLKKNTPKIVAWYPDLQHKFYPQFFTKTKLFFREWRLKKILRNAADIVLSSNDVYSQFKKFYNINPNLNFHILHFTSIIDRIDFPPIEELKRKYKIKGNFFMVSNQFWQHKNHEVVLNALKILKDEGINCQVLFTGNMAGKTTATYIERLNGILVNYDLHAYVEFAGLISREEQLCLMKNSMAVIQPSLFEGWSTVIEDAKALKCQIIASNLNVHKEQLENGKLGFLFESQNAFDLANILKDFINNKIELKPTVDNYNENIVSYGRAFIDIFFKENYSGCETRYKEAETNIIN